MKSPRYHENASAINAMISAVLNGPLSMITKLNNIGPGLPLRLETVWKLLVRVWIHVAEGKGTVNCCHLYLLPDVLVK